MDRPTLPLGGLVNHKVHSCIKGCLTLKFSGSWNTVICSSTVSEESGASKFEFSSSLSAESLSFAGEIGMVSSGTGDFGSAVVGGIWRAAMENVDR